MADRKKLKAEFKTQEQNVQQLKEKVYLIMSFTWILKIVNDVGLILWNVLYLPSAAKTLSTWVQILTAGYVLCSGDCHLLVMMMKYTVHVRNSSDLTDAVAVNYTDAWNKLGQISGVKESWDYW